MNNPISKYFADRKAAEAKAIKARREKSMADAKMGLDRSRRLMNSKACPISGSMCDVMCVHYQSGYTYDRTMVGGEVLTGFKAPSCKLWGVRNDY